MINDHHNDVRVNHTRQKVLRRSAALVAVGLLVAAAITPRPLESSSRKYLAEPVYGDDGGIDRWHCEGRCISESPQCCDVFPRPH